MKEGRGRLHHTPTHLMFSQENFDGDCHIEVACGIEEWPLPLDNLPKVLSGFSLESSPVHTHGAKKRLA